MAQINKPDLYFNTKLYTGDGANYPSTQSITGVGFQPDLIWLKSRNNAYPHFLYDAVRTNRYAIFTNDTQAENSGTVNQMTSFDSDGFKVANDGAGVATNGSGSTMTSWNWLASNTTASNTDGSISSTVSANTTSGFSVCKLNVGNTTSTFGHGLNSVPKLIIAKSLSTGNWIVYHASNGANKFMKLNTTDAVLTNANMWQNTTPTSSLVYISGSEMAPNEDVIFYCFAEKKGFSKFGGYTGNGSTDGTFVYTGFKPAFIMVKRTNTTGAWGMYDNKRDSFNVVDLGLAADLTSAEDFTTNDESDFLSNGFKLRSTGGSMNASGSTYIYMAFAENPLVGTNNIPATAR